MNLKGKAIAITRPRGQARELAELISRAGGRPYLIPTVEIRPKEDLRAVGSLLNGLIGMKADLVLFMSVNGVKVLAQASKRLGVKSELIEALNRVKVVAVGPRTAEGLRSLGVRVGIVPSRFSSEGVVECLEQLGVRGRTIFIPRSRSATGYLPKRLRELGAKVREFYLYEASLPKDTLAGAKFVKDMEEGRVDVVLFTSPSSVTNLFRIAEPVAAEGELKGLLNGRVIAAIGPVTRAALEGLCVKVDVTPRSYTIEGLVEALSRFFKGTAARSAGP